LTQTKGTGRFSARTTEDHSNDKDKIEVGTAKDQFLGLKSLKKYSDLKFYG
jgi:hypothetical protein